MLRIARDIEARATEFSMTNTLENGSLVAETSGARCDIQGGRVWVNNYRAYPDHVAFGGYRMSGFGQKPT